MTAFFVALRLTMSSVDHELNRVCHQTSTPTRTHFLRFVLLHLAIGKHAKRRVYTTVYPTLPNYESSPTPFWQA